MRDDGESEVVVMLSASGEDVWIISSTRVPYLLIEGRYTSPLTNLDVTQKLGASLRRIEHWGTASLFVRPGFEDEILAVRPQNQIAQILFLEGSVKGNDPLNFLVTDFESRFKRGFSLAAELERIIHPGLLEWDLFKLQVSLLGA